MSKWEIVFGLLTLSSVFLFFVAPSTQDITQAQYSNQTVETQPTTASANGKATFGVGSCITFSEDHHVKFTMVGTTWEVKVHNDGSYTSCRIY